MLILASKSPRRREILTRLGIEFTVLPSIADEPIIDDVSKLAGVSEFKAQDVYKQVGSTLNNKIILAADTIVYLDNNIILGKPRDAQDAHRMLSLLSGKKHQVATAITLMQADGKPKTHIETTTIFFRKISDQEITNYIEEFKPFDKAGAYAIQEPASLFIEKIEGCYSNVVGLPAPLLLRELAKLQ